MAPQPGPQVEGGPVGQKVQEALVCQQVGPHPLAGGEGLVKKPGRSQARRGVVGVADNHQVDTGSDGLDKAFV